MEQDITDYEQNWILKMTQEQNRFIYYGFGTKGILSTVVTNVFLYMCVCVCSQGAAAYPENEDQQQRLREAAEGLRVATNAAAQNAIKKKLINRLEVGDKWNSWQIEQMWKRLVSGWRDTRPRAFKDQPPLQTAWGENLPPFSSERCQAGRRCSHADHRCRSKRRRLQQEHGCASATGAELQGETQQGRFHPTFK